MDSLVASLRTTGGIGMVGVYLPSGSGPATEPAGALSCRRAGRSPTMPVSRRSPTMPRTVRGVRADRNQTCSSDEVVRSI
jgi:hypothetical protein